MPRGTEVHKMYAHLQSAGYSQAEAAKIAQAKTGVALATGRRPKTHGEYKYKSKKS
jgi:hypothetical protein